VLLGAVVVVVDVDTLAAETLVASLAADVGRMGATAGAVLVAVESGGQLGDPQARSVGQHPPPKLAGHD